MKLSISNIAFSNDSDSVFLSKIASARFDGIDIAPNKVWPNWKLPEDYGSSYRNYVYSYGLKIIGIQSLFFNAGSYNLFSCETRINEFYSHLKLISRIAISTGANKIIFGSPANRNTELVDISNIWDIAKERLRYIGDYYHTIGLKLCIEPTPKQFGGSFLCSTKETEIFIKAVNHPAICLNLDTAILDLECVSIKNTITDCGEIIGHVHASEPSLGNFSNPKIDHHKVSQTLKDINYKGTVSIEMLNQPSCDIENLEGALNYISEIYGQ